MKLIKVEIMPDGKTCKELNPMKNLSCTDPHPMWERWEKLENERQSFHIDYVNSIFLPTQLVPVEGSGPCFKPGTIHKAKIVGDKAEIRP